MLKLIIGDYNYSSWSFRPWLAAKQAGFEFEEIMIRLDQPQTRSQIYSYSPSGKLPCLLDGKLVVWDSFAICEYLAELKPSLWPRDLKERTEARCICAEMHSGFLALRQNLPMNIKASNPFGSRSVDVKADIARIIAIWESCRERFAHRGPFLFGEFSVADAMYAPMVWRFLTYSVDLPAASSAWLQTMLALPAMQEWKSRALAEE